jgi:hypothetical protein
LGRRRHNVPYTGKVIEGEPAVGVTVAQAQTGFSEMLSNTDSWIPNRAMPLLTGLVSNSVGKLREYPPSGTSDKGNLKRVSSQGMYDRTCFRVDVENLVGTNFKE